MENADVKVITADEGKIFFNGTIYSKSIILAPSDSIENWEQVPISQYEEWKESVKRNREEYKARRAARMAAMNQNND